MKNNVLTGTVCTVLICLLYCTGRFQKKKKTILAMDLLAKLLTVLMFFSFGEHTGVFSEIAGLTVITAANIRERSGRKLRGLYLFYMMVYTIVMTVTFSGLTSVLITLAALISLTSNWWFGAQKMRAADSVICIIMFSVNMLIGNYAGVTELIILACNVISYRKYHCRHRNEFLVHLRRCRRYILKTLDRFALGGPDGCRMYTDYVQKYNII